MTPEKPTAAWYQYRLSKTDANVPSKRKTVPTTATYAERRNAKAIDPRSASSEEPSATKESMFIPTCSTDACVKAAVTMRYSCRSPKTVAGEREKRASALQKSPATSTT
jgi:hypothetical protein